MTAPRTDPGTVEDLLASATKACGLDDFGSDDDNYREALGVLLESYRRDADLTEIGSKMNRFFVRNALVARLMSEAAWKQYPQHADVRIERPIFVTGLPRTGTTVLHRLMSADPRHQGLELWLAEFPQPRPPRETWSDNPVFRELDARFTQAHNENPDYTGLHFMTADEVEECWQLLRQSLHSVSYETLAHLPTYSRGWPGGTGSSPIERHRKNLAADRTQRAREALGAEEPQPSVRAQRIDGRLPRRAGGAVPSAGGDDHGVDVLAGPAHHRGLVEQLPGELIGQDAMETWSRGLELFTAERAKHDSAQFYDMDYFDLIPIRSAPSRAIYRHFGIEVTDEARAAMRASDEESKQGPRAPKHTYSLEDYGLTADAVKERFKGL